MRQRNRWWLVACALVPLAAGCTVTSGSAGPGPATTTSRPSAPATSSSAVVATQDPARFAAQVVAHAKEAGVDPHLVMAILYNESYKPHDPALERAWQRLNPDAAFGIANMHRATFDETKQGHSFAGRDWQELPDDPDLAIQAEAWYLHDLATQLPAHPSGRYTTGELLALGYNTGPGNMKAFARGTAPGAQAQSYVDNLRSNWTKAGEAIARG
ncbi:lytic transglycosylase domain-containing protein [Amycolatopsis sp. K13G38]|uniref:Lytic transglycosylase domain-containing protein n=1 Tax=Amycolatopsis acididurans TaxID=2724524 RepID=A0ABX1J8G1_9PSEU|nr:transglycosylase SLT domain-containing protein [Amycolatopsis acididurans]NKQ56072.1 lytic transglycosylase domain-containing protein [Amycolatopsis acididurans]